MYSDEFQMIQHPKRQNIIGIDPNSTWHLHLETNQDGSAVTTGNILHNL